MNLGAEPKKVAILAGLVVVGVIAFYLNSTGDTTSASAPRAVPTTVSPTAAPAVAPVSPTRSAGPRTAAVTEFRPRVGGSRPEDKIDPASIDPELKLDLLAKVQAVAPMEAGRNLFQFGAAPPPPGPIPAVPQNVQRIPITTPPPTMQPIASNQPPPTPQAPPINLKYYGYVVSKADGHKVAFLLDGEEPILATENETVKQRYKIVRIALTNIVIEDTQAKSTQTLTMQEIPG